MEYESNGSDIEIGFFEYALGFPGRISTGAGRGFGGA